MKTKPQVELKINVLSLLELKPYSGFLALCKSIHTKANYHQDLRVLKQFLDQIGITDPIKVQPIDMTRFASHLIKPNLTPSGKPRAAYSTRSVKRILASTRSFYRYLASIQHITTDPTAVFHNLAIRSPQRNPRPLQPKDRELLVRHLKTDTLDDIRISLAVLFGYHCGLRVSEISQLSLRDLDLTRGLVTVIGKGDKERVVPMTDPLVNLIQKYIQIQTEYQGQYLFPSPRTDAKPIHVDYLETWVKKAALWAKLDHAEELTVHVLRHSFGTQLAEAGASVYEIRDLMGHSSIMVSENYVKLASTKAQQAHRKAFPVTWTSMALQLQAQDGPASVLKKLRKFKGT